MVSMTDRKIGQHDTRLFSGPFIGGLTANSHALQTKDNTMTLFELVEMILGGENIPVVDSEGTSNVVDISPPPLRKSGNYDANVPDWWVQTGRPLTGDGRGLSQLEMSDDGSLAYPDA
tara:strand:- start:209 stop:562 length:354 start_codon:yes stop_codon:yes gene_type:complete